MPSVTKTNKSRPWDNPKRKPFERSKERANRHIYDSKEWKVLRAIVKEEEPLCRHCLLKGLAVDTKEIDHILSVNRGGKAFDRENLQGLCRPCHLNKSRGEARASKGAPGHSLG